MKKGLILTWIIIVGLCLNKYEKKRIPEEAIRFRVIASTNLEEDQRIKKEITKNVFAALKPIKKLQTIEETRNYMEKNLPVFHKIVDKTLKDNQIQESFHINYGKNFFPEKTYEGEIYAEGEYESLGDNFWCVLFPPICFLDENENVEYKSWLKEILDRYF